MYRKLLCNINQKLCSYFGLKQVSTVKPEYVRTEKSTILITSTEANKRHRYKNTFNEFIDKRLNQTTEENKRKLGLAIGKAIATDLEISFSAPHVVYKHSKR